MPYNNNAPSKPKETGKDRLARLANKFNTRSGEVIARNLESDSFGAGESSGVSVGGVMGGTARPPGSMIGQAKQASDDGGPATQRNRTRGNQFSYEGSKDDDDDGHGFAPLPPPSLEVHRFDRVAPSGNRAGSQVQPDRARTPLEADTSVQERKTRPRYERKRKRSDSPSSAFSMEEDHAVSRINPFAQLDELAGLPPSSPGIAEDVSDDDLVSGGSEGGGEAGGKGGIKRGSVKFRDDVGSDGCGEGADEDDDEMEEVEIPIQMTAKDSDRAGSIPSGPEVGFSYKPRTLHSTQRSSLDHPIRPPPIKASVTKISQTTKLEIDEDEDFESYPVMGESYGAPATRLTNASRSGQRAAKSVAIGEVIDLDDDEEDSIEQPTLGLGRDTDSAKAVDGKSRRAEGSPRVEEYTSQRGEITKELGRLDEEIKSIEAQLLPLQQLRSQLLAERKSLQSELNISPKRDGAHDRATHVIDTVARTNRFQLSEKIGSTDYNPSDFEWSGMLKRVMREVWDIKGFRLCQEGVCNANMDGRDILCIMPTGGGKSLTYQLPALLTPGTTIVISPLISLITDQITHLREAGVECVMLTGATSREDQNDAFKRMSDGPRRRGRESDEIKLCYVTPEKVAKSKRFMSVLEKLNSGGRLARIVIDEAHCCSQLGHDFRPDYKKLSVMKNTFPRVPILAVTATLSHKVLPDLLKILRLPPLTDGHAANSTGTIYFTAPLYRKNLHYAVVPKPANAKAAIERMARYILDTHPGQNGIVYCLSKKDSETVAQGLREASNGKIKAGVYHADIGDEEKERIYSKWRTGDLQCICATIAFGLGIDNQNTRYVLHHSISKTMDGYYQETGRAGRDGEDADCVLFYRPQDANRISSLTMAEVEGQAKVYEMLRYAQDLKTCRKIAFAKYFSASASMPTNAWDAGPSDAIETCGHCDNCLRSTDSVSTRDVTLSVWKILKVIDEVVREGGRVTLGGLADLARGLGGGSFAVQSSGGGSKKGKASKDESNLDLEELVGGKIGLSKEHTESLLVDMLLKGYLSEDYHPTAYTVNVYLQPGRQALRLSRLSKEDALECDKRGNFPVRVDMTLSVEQKASRKSTGKGEDKPPSRKRGKNATKGDREVCEAPEGIEDIELERPRNSEIGALMKGTTARRQTRFAQAVDQDPATIPKRRGLRSAGISALKNRKPSAPPDEDVIMLEGDDPDLDADPDSDGLSELTDESDRMQNMDAGSRGEGDEDEDGGADEEDMEEVGAKGWGEDGRFF